MRTKTIPTLPEELWLEILYRLPAESLVRFMCVCKTWHQLIATPHFTKSHIAHQTASSSNKYIFYEDNNMCTLFTDTNSLFDGTKHSKLHYTPELFVTDSTCDRYFFEIHGVCDGLVCFSHQSLVDDVVQIFLWNPICRKAKKLPPINSIIDDSRAGLSFGYDGADYKVILVARVDKSYVVSVYSLSKNSWNNASNLSSEGEWDEGFFLATKFVDGTAYMMTCSRGIICFKLSNETIRVIRLPAECWGVTMEAYGETVAVLGHEEGSTCLSMWILRDNSSSSSSSSSWEKKFSTQVQEVGYHHQAVGFLNNGKYLFRIFKFEGDLCFVTKLYLCDVEDCPKLTEFRSIAGLRSRFRLPPKYPNYHGRIHSNFTGSLLLFNEDSVDPFVQTEMEPWCSSMLFTLQWERTQ